MKVRSITEFCNHLKLVEDRAIRCWWCGWLCWSGPTEIESVDDILDRYGMAARAPRRGPRPA